MRPARNPAQGLALLVLAGVAAGCGDSPRSIRMDGTVTLQLSDRFRSVDVGARVDDERTDGRVFEELWAALVDGRSPAGGFAVTVSGTTYYDDGIDVMPGIVLVLPASLAAGEAYGIGAVNTPPGAGGALPDHVGEWGARALQQPGTAELALRIVRYRLADDGIESEWIATGASGTIDVASRADGRVDLDLDITATDEAGTPVELRGRLRILAEQRGSLY